MKRLFMALGLLLTASLCWADATSYDISTTRPDAYWWSGHPSADTAWLWAKAVDDLLDGTTAITSTMDFDQKLLFGEISAPSGNPAANHGWLYVKDNGSGTTTLYFEDSGGTVTSCIAGAGTPAGSDTQMQYNNDGAFGAISTIIWDDTNLEFANDQSLAFGTEADWTVNFDDSVDDQLLLATALTAAAATTDPMFEILLDTGHANGTSMTDDQQVFGVAKGSQASNTALFTVDEDGDGVFAGSLTLGSTLYQTAVVAAAAGNENLTVDAAGNGTITLAGTSTGKIILTTAAELDGNVTLGDASSDTITVSGTVISGVTLDDGTTDSPALTLQDATNETCAIVKKDDGDTEVTIPADTDFEIVTGNLAVGNGSPGVAAMDGEDFYVNGASEFDGAVQFDGAITINATSNVLRSNEAITFSHAANGSGDDLTISQTGNQDASFILQSAGSGTDALSLATVTNGGDIKVNSNGKVDIDAADDIDIQVTSGGDAEDLLLTQSGTHNAGIILTSAGTGSDAISLQMDGTGGGLDVDTDDGAISLVADGAANGDITIDAQDKVTIVSTDSDGTDSIYLHANGGTSEVIKIHADQGNTATSLNLVSDAGGITLNAATGVVFTQGQTRKLLIPIEDVELDGAAPPGVGQNGTNGQAVFPSLEFDATGATGDDIVFIHWVVPDGYVVDSGRLNVYWSHDTAETDGDDVVFDMAVNAVAAGETLDAAGTAFTEGDTDLPDGDGSQGKLQVTQLNFEVEEIAVDDFVTIKFWVDESASDLDASETCDVHYFEIEWESTE